MTASVTTPHETPHVSTEVGRLLVVLNGEMHRDELMAALGLSDRKHFLLRYQQPALAAGLVEMTRPDKPRSRERRYRLTNLGERVKRSRR